MTCSSKSIIYNEIFDENSLPSEEEVRQYAVKIGINPDTEKHLLNIALDGLMSPLPPDWKPCMDERVDRIYYYNTKTHKTQWTHPLDEQFENLVKKKRQEESLSAGDDDSKTSIKEDLKSFEEAVTTSDMISSRNTATTHKSRLSSSSQMNSSKTLKDPSPDGKKVLNPIGRPPLPPKRRGGSTSPKRGGLSGTERGSLSLRLSPSPSPSRIDIDSIGVPVPISLPSPEIKYDKQSSSRSPAIKLTGGGSAFLKSKQNLTPSPSEESKLPSEIALFENVKEAESIDSPDDEKVYETKKTDERPLTHSASLGESGYDKLINSKKFASLQDSLLSLKNEMELSTSEVKSPNTSAPGALRGILREKPSPTTKLWDVDPVLLTSEEKEKLRIQEMKDERKQNVRFADIINKPINIQFSKSDSEDDESTSNDSSNDLDDLISENVHYDFEDKKENKDLDLSTRKEHAMQDLAAEIHGFNIKTTNKNVLSRLTDLDSESDKKEIIRDTNKKIARSENNNKDEDELWLTGTENIVNQNKQKPQLVQHMFDNTKLRWDSENNPLDKLSKNTNANSHITKENSKIGDRLTSSTKVPTIMNMLDGGNYNPLQTSSENAKFSNTNHVDVENINQEENDDLSKPTGIFRKSKLMPEMDLQKVFESVRDSIIINSTEHSDASEEVELMETSPLGGDEILLALEKNEEDLKHLKTVKSDDMMQRKYARQNEDIFEDYKDQQQKILDEKRASLLVKFEENIKELKKELQRQESLEKQRIYMEVQQKMVDYKEEIEKEKSKRETELRKMCEDYIIEMEQLLSKDKELRIKKMKEEHEAFLKDQEMKMKEEKEQFEEEKKLRLSTSSSQLEKIVAELKENKEKEISRLNAESSKKLEEIRQKIELEQVEQEKKYKQELAIVEAENERLLSEKQKELERIRCEQEVELVTVRSQHEETFQQLAEQHRLTVRQLQDQFRQEEESLRRKHAERIDALNAQLSRTSDKEDITQLNREFEKVRCEKRLLEDKYKSLKEKYVRLKNEVRLSMERKRQAKLNRQLQQRDPASTTEDTTERSTDHGKPPLARKKPVAALSFDEATSDNVNGTPKTIKRRPKPLTSLTSSATAESSITPPVKPKNVWIPSPHKRREGVSSAEDNHTSVSEEIQLEKDSQAGDKWTQSALTPLENLRKQLEKLDDLEEQFPTSVHTDTYLRYPFSGPAGGSCELDFYRHRLHLERESVRRAKQALSEQRVNIESRQMQLRHKQHTETLHQLHQEERELTDMEVSLHRTQALLGEKIIRLRYLEQSIDRAATYTPHHSKDTTTITTTDSSGFSGSDLDISNGKFLGGRPEAFWTENVLQSLENINSEIREIWTILGKQQVPGIGPPPDSRTLGSVDSYNMAPHRATDIADRTRRLKEWLIRNRDQQTHMIAPVTL